MEMERTEQLVFVGFNSVISVITTVANTIALLLFFKQRNTLRKTHAYVVSLGIGDFLQGCIGIPLTIVLCFTAPLESLDCVTICAVRLSICMTSLFNTVAASIERYWAVNHPIHYRTKANSKIIGGSIVCCWIFGWIIGCLCFVFAKEPDESDLSCFEIRKRYHAAFLTFIVLVAIPLSCVIIIFAYVLVYRRWRKTIKPSFGTITLKQIARQMFQGISGESVMTSTGDIIERRKIREIRTTILMFSTVFLFILCWFPWPIILNLIRTYSMSKLNYRQTSMICYTFVSLNSMINPFLYVYHLDKWNKSLKKLFSIRKKEKLPIGQ